MSTTVNETPQPPRTRGFRIGVCVIMAGFATPLLIPLVLTSGLSSSWKGTMTALLAIGIPELLMLAGVALMGKPGFEYFKGRVFAMLGRVAPPERVSRGRYRTGLVLLAIPVLFGWVSPYLEEFLPSHTTIRIQAALVGDLLLLIALLTLGGEFWEKLKALFIQEARVVVNAPIDGPRNA